MRNARNASAPSTCACTGVEYLASAEAQAWYAEVNHEYPIRSDIPVSSTLAAMGKFKADTLSLHRLGQYNAEAVKLMDRAGWK